MGRVRVEEPGIVERKGRIAMWEGHISRWETMRQDQDRPSMKMLKAALAAAKKHAEGILVELAKNPSADRAKDENLQLQSGGRLLAYEEIIADLEIDDKKIDNAKEKIQQLKNEIAAAEKTGVVTTRR